MENDVRQTSKGVKIQIRASTYEKLKNIAKREGLTIEEAVMLATCHFMNTKMKEYRTNY